MSAAQPIRAHEVVRGRPKGAEAYIPGWAPPISSEDLVRPVVAKGKPLGFTLEQVLPERRWAVDSKTGEVMDRRDFGDAYQQWVSYTVVGGDKIESVQKANRYFAAQDAPIPDPVHFVSRALDYQWKEVAIGYDAEKPATATEKDVKIWTARGEEWLPNAVGLKPAEISAKLELLTALFGKGQIPQETYLAEVQSLTQAAAAGPVEEPKSEAPEGFVLAEPMDAEKLTCAKCGRVCGSVAGKAAHERHCETPEEVA